MWWTAFTPLVFALLHSDMAVGANRIAFNVALLVLSPIAGVVAERVATRKLLLATTASRMVIWSALLPIFYFANMSPPSSGGDGDGDGAALAAEDEGALTRSATAMYWSLLVCSLLDGASVAFSNVVDIDMGGLDLLAGQHGVPVGDTLRPSCILAELRSTFSRLWTPCFSTAAIRPGFLFPRIALLPFHFF